MKAVGRASGGTRSRIHLVVATCLVSALAGSTVCGQTFVDVSSLADMPTYSVDVPKMATGLAAADYDDDGYVDLFVPTGKHSANLLLRNLGDGTFAEIGDSVGLGGVYAARAALWLDYDGDGDLDLLVTGDCWPGGCLAAASAVRLFQQQNNGTFLEVTASCGLFDAASDYSSNNHRGGIAAGDLDHDGDLDLFLGMWGGESSRLFANQADGTFDDLTGTSGLGTGDNYWQTVLHDFNGDGWTDLFSAIDFGKNRLWVNQQDGTFTDQAATAGVEGVLCPQCQQGSSNEMGVALGDHDGDGDFDIYATNIFESAGGITKHNRLFRNDSAGGTLAFEEVAQDLGVDDTGWGWGTTFLDGDNDRRLDLAATNGFRIPPWITDASRYFRGTVAGFTEVSTAVGFDDTDIGSALVAFDYDRDGDLDLAQTVLATPSRVRLLENQLYNSAASDHYLTVLPRMAGPNSRAVGAVVRVTAGGDEMMRLITAGTSLLGQEPFEAHFGLGDADGADELTMEWPDGAVSHYTGVSGDRLLRIDTGIPGDLVISKDDAASELLPGGTTTYTLVVRNLGPGEVTGATVSDVLPAGLDCSWTCVGLNGACTAGPIAGDIEDTVNLLAGGRARYSLVCDIDGGAGGWLVNQATVSPPATFVDTDASNNSAVDDNVVLTAGDCGTFEDRFLTGLTLDATETITACNSIAVGQGATLLSPGDIVLHAPTVAFRTGFSAVSGGLRVLNGVPGS